MIEFIEWFQVNYPELKQNLLMCHHNYSEDENNPYHIEGDCWSHTMMVCKIAELYSYDKVVQVAALLHDIGKPESRCIDSKKRHVLFKGHEALSAKMAEPLVFDLLQRELLSMKEAAEVIDLIELHAYLYQEKNTKTIVKKFQNRPNFFKHLVELNRCDDLGRFSSMMGKSTLDTDAILEQLNN